MEVSACDSLIMDIKTTLGCGIEGSRWVRYTLRVSICSKLVGLTVGLSRKGKSMDWGCAILVAPHMMKVYSKR